MATASRKLQGKGATLPAPFKAPEPPAPIEQDPAKAAAQFRLAAQGHALKALEALVTLAESAPSEAVRASAANAVIDRAYGRPAQAARGGGEVDPDDGQRVRLKVRWLENGQWPEPSPGPGRG